MLNEWQSITATDGNATQFATGVSVSEHPRRVFRRPNIGEIMRRVYRISNGPDVGEVVGSVDALMAFARENGPGRYQVDEHADQPLPGRNAMARACGTVIHQPDGQVTFKPFFFGYHPLGQDSRPIDRKFPLEFRAAYEHASRWIELVGFKGTSSHQEFARHLSFLANSIRAAVIREMGAANTNVVMAAVQCAIDDAIAGRVRRWRATDPV
jgi:hypothetical protein